MKELYIVTVQLDEEVLFQIGCLADIATSHLIQSRDVQYDIVCMDLFEGYRADLRLYCKRKMKSRNHDIILKIRFAVLYF